jgi:hypothetical protein
MNVPEFKKGQKRQNYAKHCEPSSEKISQAGRIKEEELLTGKYLPNCASIQEG